jgi:hypothetical protein
MKLARVLVRDKNPAVGTSMYCVTKGDVITLEQGLVHITNKAGVKSITPASNCTWLFPPEDEPKKGAKS